MTKRFDILDLKILEGLGNFGPRNITAVAKKLGIHPETMRFRVNRMVSQNFVAFHANVYHTNIGLKKATIFAEAVPGYEDLLFNCLKANNFWIYLCRCYGQFEGWLGIYAVPVEHSSRFEEFLHQVEKLKVAQSIQVFWSTCFQDLPITCNWFDPQSETWKFKWDEWIEEIPTKGTKLPYTLVDPEDFPVKGDEIDIFILDKMEVDATISFEDLAKMLNLTRQGVRYHFREHILERGLIEGFQIAFFPFDRAISDTFFFVFNFPSEEEMTKFALSLLDKPFVFILGKILGKNDLIAYISLPKKEFRKFIDSLSKLVKNGFLQNYNYIILDIDRTLRQTVCPEFFKDGSWIYKHKKHIEDLRNLVKHSLRQVK